MGVSEASVSVRVPHQVKEFLQENGFNLSKIGRDALIQVYEIHAYDALEQIRMEKKKEEERIEKAKRRFEILEKQEQEILKADQEKKKQSDLEVMRLKLYSKRKDSWFKQYNKNKNSINWSNLADILYFDKSNDVKQWLLNKFVEDGLINQYEGE